MRKAHDTVTATRYFTLRLSHTPKVVAPNGATRGTCPAKDVALAGNYHVCINAGLFYPLPETWQPEGIIIRDGRVIQNKGATYYPDSMPMTIGKDGKLWYAAADADADELAKQGIVGAVCGFGPIVIDGKAVPRERWPKVPHYEVPHLRQIIGQYANGDYAVVTCEGRGYADSTGWTIADAQRVCLEMGLDFAYNLDGGTSTELVVDGVQYTETHRRDAGRYASTFLVW